MMLISGCAVNVGDALAVALSIWAALARCQRRVSAEACPKVLV